MTKIHKHLSLLILILLSQNSFADLKSAVMNRHFSSISKIKNDYGGTKEGVFSQLINHEDQTDKRTFNQRYYYNSNYAVNSKSPVIYFICGEVECTGEELTTGFAKSLAKSLKANVVALEHRYYGDSQPFNLLTSQNLRFLKTSQALADLDAFQKFAQSNLGFTGKWIAMGGSYAGNLSAWYRLKYPQNVVGALASSAPVKAKADFEEYDKHMSSVIDSQCAANIRSVVKQVEESLLTPQSAFNVRKMFEATDIKEDLDFIYVVSDMAAWFIQYGQSERLCYALSSSENLMLSYARAGLRLFETVGITPEMASMQSAEGLKPGSNSVFGLRQWMYQSCSEFGFFQVAYHDSKVSVRSDKVNLAYHNAVCDRLFGFKSQVDTDSTNNNYYLPLLNPDTSRIFFTNGSVDPWSTLSISIENGNNTNPNLQYVTMNGASHCSDLSIDDLDVVTATQVKFTKLANEWLKN